MSELTYGLTAAIDVVDSCFLEVSAFDGIVVSETVTVVSYYYLQLMYSMSLSTFLFKAVVS